tara:strand:+ start:118 stop:735 length:618 start_codon:yes stop_codon:yes gene_type:complete
MANFIENNFHENDKNLFDLSNALRFYINKQEINCNNDTKMLLQINNVANCKQFFSYLKEKNMLESIYNSKHLILNLGKVKENLGPIKVLEDEWNDLPSMIKDWLFFKYNGKGRMEYENSFLRKNCIINKYNFPIQSLEQYLPKEIFESLQWNFIPEYQKKRLFDDVKASKMKIKELERQIEILTQKVDNLNGQDKNKRFRKSPIH